MTTTQGIRLGKAFVELGIVDATQRGMNAVGNSLMAIGRQLQRLGMTSMKVGAALAIPAILALREYEKFEAQVARTRTAIEDIDGSVDPDQSLRRQARELGRSTVFTATEAAAAQEIFGRANFGVDEIKKMTPEVLKLAQATGSDMTTAADLLVSTLRQFNETADESNSIVSMLTKGTTGSNMNLIELSEAMKLGGIAGNQMNQGLAKTIATFGVLADSAQKGTRGGQQFRRLLLDLAAKEDKITKVANALKEAGLAAGIDVSVADAEGNFRPIEDIIGDFQDMLTESGVGAVKTGAIINFIFQKLGTTPTLVIGQMRDRIKELTKEIEEAAKNDLASKLQKMNNNTFPARIKLLTSAFSDLGISIGEAIDKSLHLTDEVFPRFAESVNEVSDWVQENETLVTSYLKLVGVLIGGGGLAFALGTILGLGGAMLMLTVGLTTNIAALATILGGPAILAFTAVFVGLMITGVLNSRKLITSIKLLGKEMENLGKIFHVAAKTGSFDLFFKLLDLRFQLAFLGIKNRFNKLIFDLLDTANAFVTELSRGIVEEFGKDTNFQIKFFGTDHMQSLINKGLQNEIKLVKEMANIYTTLEKRADALENRGIDRNRLRRGGPDTDIPAPPGPPPLPNFPSPSEFRTAIEGADFRSGAAMRNFAANQQNQVDESNDHLSDIADFTKGIRDNTKNLPDLDIEGI